MSSFTAQQRHDKIIAYLEEMNKPTKVFHLRWKAGDLINTKVITTTPMFWYMKYSWARKEIEGMFFVAEVEIDSVFDQALQQVFGGSAGPRWKGGGPELERKGWRNRGYESTKPWYGKQGGKLKNPNANKRDPNVDVQGNTDSGLMKNKLNTKLQPKSEDIWNAMSDFGKNKRVNYKQFSDNMAEKGVKVSPMLAKQLFDQIAGADGTISRQQMEELLRKLDAMQLPDNFAGITMADLGDTINCMTLMKRVLLAAGAGDPFDVDDFIVNVKFGLNMGVINFMGKLSDRDVPWDQRVAAMENISANIGANAQYASLFAPENIPELLCGWAAQTLDQRPEVQKTAIELLPNVYHEVLTKGDQGLAVGQLEEILDNLFKVLDDPNCSKNHPASKDAIDRVVDDIVKIRDPEALLFLAGLLSEKCDIENCNSAQARNFALQQLQKIMFSSESPYLSFDKAKTSAPTVEEALLPNKGTANREWLDVATNQKPGPSDAFLNYEDEIYMDDEQSGMKGKNVRSQQHEMKENRDPDAGEDDGENMASSLKGRNRSARYGKWPKGRNNGAEVAKPSPDGKNSAPDVARYPFAKLEQLNPDAGPGEPAIFDASKSYAADGGPLEFEFDFGDGTKSTDPEYEPPVNPFAAPIDPNDPNSANNPNNPNSPNNPIPKASPSGNNRSFDPSNKNDPKYHPKSDPTEPNYDPKKDPRGNHRSPAYDPAFDPNDPMGKKNSPIGKNKSQNPNLPKDVTNQDDPKYDPKTDPTAQRYNPKKDPRADKNDPKHDPTFDPSDPMASTEDPSNPNLPKDVTNKHNPKYDAKTDPTDPKYNPRSDPRGKKTSPKYDPTFDATDPLGDKVSNKNPDDPENKENPRAEKVFPKPGRYPVTVTVTDPKTGLSSTDTVVQDVKPHVAPTAILEKLTPDATPGEPAVFDASKSSAPDGGPLEFVFDFGDGTKSTDPEYNPPPNPYKNPENPSHPTGAPGDKTSGVPNKTNPNLPEDVTNKSDPLYDPKTDPTDPKYNPKKDPRANKRDPKYDPTFDPEKPLGENAPTKGTPLNPNLPKDVTNKSDPKYAPETDPTEPSYNAANDPRGDPNDPKHDPAFDPNDPLGEDTNPNNPNLPKDVTNKSSPKYDPQSDPTDPKYEPKEDPRGKKNDPKYDPSFSPDDPLGIGPVLQNPNLPKDVTNKSDPKYAAATDPTDPKYNAKKDPRGKKQDPKYDPTFDPAQPLANNDNPVNANLPKDVTNKGDPKYAPETDPTAPKYNPGKDPRGKKNDPKYDPSFDPNDPMEETCNPINAALPKDVTDKSHPKYDPRTDPSDPKYNALKDPRGKKTHPKYDPNFDSSDPSAASSPSEEPSNNNKKKPMGKRPRGKPGNKSNNNNPDDAKDPNDDPYADDPEADNPYSPNNKAALADDNKDPDDPTNLENPRAQNVFNKPGTFPVSVTVTDPRTGLSSTAEVEQDVTPEDEEKPLAVLEQLTPNARPGQPISFDASKSKSASGKPLIFEYDFGDGTKSTDPEYNPPPNPKHDPNGEFPPGPATKRSPDGKNASSDPEPSSDPRKSPAGRNKSSDPRKKSPAGRNQYLDPSESKEDPAAGPDDEAEPRASPVGYPNDDFVNPDDPENKENPRGCVIFDKPGVYPVTVTVTDPDTGKQSVDRVYQEVGDPSEPGFNKRNYAGGVSPEAPVAILEQLTPNARPGQPASFDASKSKSPSGQPLEFEYDYGDGTKSTDPDYNPPPNPEVFPEGEFPPGPATKREQPSKKTGSGSNPNLPKDVTNKSDPKYDPKCDPTDSKYNPFKDPRGKKRNPKYDPTFETSDPLGKNKKPAVLPKSSKPGKNKAQTPVKDNPNLPKDVTNKDDPRYDPATDPTAPRYNAKKDPRANKRDPKHDPSFKPSAPMKSTEDPNNPNLPKDVTNKHNPKYDAKTDPTDPDYNPKTDPRLDENDPKYDPSFDPSDPVGNSNLPTDVTDQDDPRYDAKTDPTAPRYNPKTDPRADPADPKHDPTFDPSDPMASTEDAMNRNLPKDVTNKHNPKYDPQCDPSDPDYDPKSDPRSNKTSPKYDPNFDPSFDPNNDPNDPANAGFPSPDNRESPKGYPNSKFKDADDPLNEANPRGSNIFDAPGIYPVDVTVTDPSTGKKNTDRVYQQVGEPSGAGSNRRNYAGPYVPQLADDEPAAGGPPRNKNHGGNKGRGKKNDPNFQGPFGKPGNQGKEPYGPGNDGAGKNPDDSKEQPGENEEIGDEFRNVINDGVSKAIMDPNKDNQEHAKKLTDVLRQLNPKFPDDLDPDAKMRFKKWKAGPLKAMPKWRPPPKKRLPQMKAAKAQEHVVNMEFQLNFAPTNLPNI